VLEQGGTLCTWRAPTDNDEACAFSAITRPVEDSFALMPLRYRLGAWIGARLPLCCLGPLQVLATWLGVGLGLGSGLRLGLSPIIC